MEGTTSTSLGQGLGLQQLASMPACGGPLDLSSSSAGLKNQASAIFVGCESTCVEQGRQAGGDAVDRCVGQHRG